MEVKYRVVQPLVAESNLEAKSTETFKSIPSPLLAKVVSSTLLLWWI
jgi:hypothetical protein